jgi:hypothetical protein
MRYLDLSLEVPACGAKETEALVRDEHAEEIDEGNPQSNPSEPD